MSYLSGWYEAKGDSRRGSTRRSSVPPPAAGTSALSGWRTRHWYPALDAAGIEQRDQVRHTSATEALAAPISNFELARVMGTSVKMIDRTYGHLVRDSEAPMRQRLDASAAL